MKYMIFRTSDFDNKPCEEAYLDKYISIDERAVDAPSKIIDGDDWYKEGKNHRIENGHIKRDFEDEEYFIDIDSLEKLNNLSSKYGEIIISSSGDNEKKYMILIRG